MVQGRKIDWESVKPDILSRLEGRFSLEKVRNDIKQRHGFHVGRRSWFNKLKEWRKEIGLENKSTAVTRLASNGANICCALGSANKTSELMDSSRDIAVAADDVDDDLALVQVDRIHCGYGATQIKALEQEVLRLEDSFAELQRERDAIAEENRRLTAYGIQHDFSGSLGSLTEGHHSGDITRSLPPCNLDSAEQLLTGNPGMRRVDHEALFTRLSSNNDSNKIRHLLAQEIFQEGRDNILHICATRCASITTSHEGSSCLNHELRRVLNYMKSRNLGIDTRDAKGRTALELAILEGNTANVATLLEAGASTMATDDRGEQALHLAVRATPISPEMDMMVEMLLAHKAEACSRDREGQSPLFLLLARLHEIPLSAIQCSSPAYIQQCEVIQRLVDQTSENALQQDDSTFSSMVEFLVSRLGEHTEADRSRELSEADRLRELRDAKFDPLLQCLRCFLAKGWFPLIAKLDFSICCRKNSCVSLVDFAAFHDRIGKVWKAIVSTVDLAIYGDYLLFKVLDLCPDRSNGVDLSSHLRQLRERGFKSSNSAVQAHALHRLLALPHSEHKLALLRTLTRNNMRLDIHSRHEQLWSDGPPRRPIEQIIVAARHNFEPHPDWDVVEALLATGLSKARYAKPYPSSGSDELFIYGHSCLRYLTPKYQDHLNKYLSCNARVYRNLQVDNDVCWSLHLCVLHMVTKHLVRILGPVPGDPRSCQKLSDAVQIRKACDLPIVEGGQQIFLIHPHMPAGPVLAARITMLKRNLGLTGKEAISSIAAHAGVNATKASNGRAFDGVIRL